MICNKFISSIMTIAMLSNSSIVFASASKSSSPSVVKFVNYDSLVAASAHTGNSATVHEAFKDFLKDLHSGIDKQTAYKALAEKVVSKNISMADIDIYISQKATNKEYFEFRSSFNSAMKGVNMKNISVDEFVQVLSAGLDKVRPEGLAWSGCVGFGIGAVVIVAAAIVGIAVANHLGRTKAQIEADYNSKRLDAEARYNNEVYADNHHTEQLQAQVVSLQNTVNNDNIQIAVYQSKIDDCAISGTCDQATVQSYIDKRNAYQTERTNSLNKITNLTNEIAIWSTPGYLAGQLAIDAQQYELELADLSSEEQGDINLIPINQDKAKNLRVGSAVAGAMGAYFAIDGGIDCF